jgi:hypothetical protein
MQTDRSDMVQVKSGRATDRYSPRSIRDRSRRVKFEKIQSGSPLASGGRTPMGQARSGPIGPFFYKFKKPQKIKKSLEK